MTQPEFAVFAGVAGVTVARWETSHPPHGEALLVLVRASKKATTKKYGCAWRFAEQFCNMYTKELYDSAISYGVQLHCSFSFER